MNFNNNHIPADQRVSYRNKGFKNYKSKRQICNPKRLYNVNEIKI